ncbi:sterile alpha motif domain-containing protein 15 [Exaiptasia diaphana]|uniref:SAM domain-containing protein n=1 Tax=Exaiptasia diaphana TaxID=2652724 RepID=A0A913Y3Q8_EXADI|nr:sterile alpha motif domain-containing protein 15 [Exaiptasia diaphana]KXJ28974.1 Sterile alpha motif domain-containing protein 15 [Exaiptasia diaphana]
MADTGLIRSSRKTPTKFDLHGYEPAFERDGTPSCLTWSVEDVADWIDYLGFPQYRGPFADNLVNGRRLINIDASAMPNLGITDFEDIKIITKKIREALGVEEPYWNRSISLKHRETLGLYLERKSKTGTDADALTFEDFRHELEKEERFKMKNAKQPSFLK